MRPEIPPARPRDRSANREGKKDKVAVCDGAALPLPNRIRRPWSNPAGLRVRQALSFDAATSEDRAADSGVIREAVNPKAAAKPAVQKSYALLSDVQIAGIKERLKLSSDQEYHWPAVENALRAVARKIHATRKADPNATGAPIDPECAGGAAIEIGDAVAVPVARGPEARGSAARASSDWERWRR